MHRCVIFSMTPVASIEGNQLTKSVVTITQLACGQLFPLIFTTSNREEMNNKKESRVPNCTALWSTIGLCDAALILASGTRWTAAPFRNGMLLGSTQLDAAESLWEDEECDEDDSEEDDDDRNKDEMPSILAENIRRSWVVPSSFPMLLISCSSEIKAYIKMAGSGLEGGMLPPTVHAVQALREVLCQRKIWHSMKRGYIQAYTEGRTVSAHLGPMSGHPSFPEFQEALIENNAK